MHKLFFPYAKNVFGISVAKSFRTGPNLWETYILGMNLTFEIGLGTPSISGN